MRVTLNSRRLSRLKRSPASARRIWALLAVAVAAILLYGAGRPRSYLIEARSMSADLTLTSTASGPWRFPALTACFRKEKRDRSASTPAGSRCDARLFDEVHYGEPAEIAWSDGSRLELRRTDASWNAGLEILVKDPSPGAENGRPVSPGRINGRELRPGSLVFVRNADWIAAGTLLFTGETVIGSVPFNNSSAILLEGRYEIREKPISASLTDFLTGSSSSTMPVQTGTFFRGDELRLVGSTPGSTKPVPLSGYVAATGPEAAGLNFLLYGPAGSSVLEVNRYAAHTDGSPGAPSRIEPSWMDRAIRDPFLLALSAILALLVASIEITNAVSGWLSSRPSAKAPAGEVPEAPPVNKDDAPDHARPAASSEPASGPQPSLAAMRDDARKAREEGT